MANAAHQARSEIAPGDEAARPGRAEQAERGRREAFSLAAERQQQAMKARSGKEECSAQQQGNNGSEGLRHQSVPGSGVVV